MIYYLLVFYTNVFFFFLYNISTHLHNNCISLKYLFIYTNYYNLKFYTSLEKSK